MYKSYVYMNELFNEIKQIENDKFNQEIHLFYIKKL